MRSAAGALFVAGAVVLFVRGWRAPRDGAFFVASFLMGVALLPSNDPTFTVGASLALYLWIPALLLLWFTRTTPSVRAGKDLRRRIIAAIVVEVLVLVPLGFLWSLDTGFMPSEWVADSPAFPRAEDALGHLEQLAGRPLLGGSRVILATPGSASLERTWLGMTELRGTAEDQGAPPDPAWRLTSVTFGPGRTAQELVIMVFVVLGAQVIATRIPSHRAIRPFPDPAPAR